MAGAASSLSCPQKSPPKPVQSSHRPPRVLPLATPPPPSQPPSRTSSPSAAAFSSVASPPTVLRLRRATIAQERAVGACVPGIVLPLEQVKMTLKNFFLGRTDLYLLQIDTAMLADGLIYEASGDVITFLISMALIGALHPFY